MVFCQAGYDFHCVLQYFYDFGYAFALERQNIDLINNNEKLAMGKGIKEKQVAIMG